ncbi:glycosyltransferase [Paenibacillus pasadenensis]|uniref:glycosyltransferase n=1 Tax=Paenibacillus pasadenensis TaxID=217090 RepID=UPI00204068F1|nr:glycosyltransferase [Paenibacillus pasadenensis]
MPTISLCMIVKNEEELLEQCLNSLRGVADEIIIADTGSTDRTKEIARSYTEHVLDFTWVDDFSAARNYVFSQASQEYIFWLDADDVLLDEDRNKLLALKEELDPSIDGCSMFYHYSFDDYGKVNLKFRRNRLVKRSREFKWHGAVHEYLDVSGNVIDTDIAVTHKRVHEAKGRNLTIYENKLRGGAQLSPRDQYYYANELRDNGDHARAAQQYERFLEMEQGWVADKVAACDKLSDCYYRLGEHDKERQAALRALEYDTPRAEICCRLGYHFLLREKYSIAVFWYKLAASLDQPEEDWGFRNEQCWTWLPHVQLSVCYYRLGKERLAWEHNEQALRYRPQDQRLLGNKLFFEARFKERGEFV